MSPSVSLVWCSWRVPAAGYRVGGRYPRVIFSGPVWPAAERGADQGGIGEQGGEVVRHDGVEVVRADWPGGAGRAAVAPAGVAAGAPVVVDVFARAAGRGAVVAVPAGPADGQALQQGRDLGLAGGAPPVVGPPLLRAGEGVLGDDGRDGDLGPFLAGPGHGFGRAGRGPSLQPGDPVHGEPPGPAAGLAERAAAAPGRGRPPPPRPPPAPPWRAR